MVSSATIMSQSDSDGGRRGRDAVDDCSADCAANCRHADAARGFYSKYEPKEVLGKGLSSVVRRCVCKQTGREYAVKIMDISANVVDEEGLTLKEQIRREAEILRRVSGHPNIVSLHDVYESKTFIFLVFELCRNGELFDYLTSKVRLSEKRVRFIMKQVLEAVLHCHQLNVVHRDLKPENILLDDELNVKLTDFGFAKVLQGGERLYEVCGTPGYLAPELLKAGMLEREECNGYSFEVDAWACGVIMYTLLVGCPPFWHRKQLQMIRMIMEGRYSFSSPDWNSVTDEAKHLISRFLMVEPEKRLTIAGALQHAVFKAPRASFMSRQSSIDPPGAAATLMSQISVENVLPEVSVTPAKEVEAVRETIKSAEPSPAPPPVPPPPRFNARRALRIGMLCVQFLVRFRRLKFTPEPLSLSASRINPYGMRAFRKVIDGTAFHLYSHWVKRGEGQNRAALFQHTTKRDAVNRQMRLSARAQRQARGQPTQ